MFFMLYELCINNCSLCVEVYTETFKNKKRINNVKKKNVLADRGQTLHELGCSEALAK